MPGEFDQRRVVEGNGSATNRAAASANPMCCSFTVVRGSSASCPGSTLLGGSSCADQFRDLYALESHSWTVFCVPGLVSGSGARRAIV
jgi:hypothetical protein